MKKIIIVLVAIIAIGSGIVVSLAKAGVFSRPNEDTKTTEYVAEASEPEEETTDIEVETHSEDEGLSDDDLLLRAAKQSLTVNVTQEVLDRYNLNYSQIFLDSSMPTRNKERVMAAQAVGWGEEGMAMYDAVEFPLPTVEKGKEKYSDEDVKEMHEANMERHARNIIVSMMTLEGMEEMTMSDKTAIADLNADWIEKPLAAYREYGIGIFLTYHTKYWEKYGIELPHDGQSVEEWRMDHPSAPEVTEDLMELVLEDVEEPETGNNLKDLYGLKGQEISQAPTYRLYVTSDGEYNYIDMVVKPLMMWFDRLTCEGVETYSTWKYWYLNSAMDGNKVRALMNTDKTRVESLPSLNYSIRVKYSNGKTREVFFGYNIYDNRLEIFELDAEPSKPEQPKNPPNSGGNTNPPNPGGSTNPPNPDGNNDTTNPPNPDGHDPNPPGPNPPGPNPPVPVTPQKDSYDSSAQQGNGQTGGGNGQGGTGAPTGDRSKDDMQDAGGGADHNQGHSNPVTVTPDTPSSSDTGHSDNSAGTGSNGQNAPADDHNSNTVENTNESQMNYGEDSGAKSNDNVDTSGSGAASGTDGDMSNDTNESAIGEPGI